MFRWSKVMCFLLPAWTLVASISGACLFVSDVIMQKGGVFVCEMGMQHSFILWALHRSCMPQRILWEAVRTSSHSLHHAFWAWGYTRWFKNPKKEVPQGIMPLRSPHILIFLPASKKLH